MHRHKHTPVNSGNALSKNAFSIPSEATPLPAGQLQDWHSTVDHPSGV